METEVGKGVAMITRLRRGVVKLWKNSILLRTSPYWGGATFCFWLLFPSTQAEYAQYAVEGAALARSVWQLPTTAIGQWIIAGAGFALVGFAIWNSFAQQGRQDKFGREAIDEILRVPRLIMHQVARQHALRFAEEQLRSGDFLIAQLKVWIPEMKGGGSISSWEFDRKYDIEITTSRALQNLTHAASVGAIPIDTSRVTKPRPVMPIADPGLGGNFRPEANEAFFEAYECNIAVLEAITTQLKERLPRLRDEIGMAMEEALRAN